MAAPDVPGVLNRKNDREETTVLLTLAGTGYGLIGILVIILLVLMIVYFMRRA